MCGTRAGLEDEWCRDGSKRNFNFGYKGGGGTIQTYVLPMGNPHFFFALTWTLVEYWAGSNTRDHY
jgi:hypothetical protein